MTIAEFINKVGFKVKNEDVDKVNNTISGIKDTATKLLGAIGIGFSLTAVNGLVEEFTRVNNQIRNATEALGDQRDIQEEIMAAAEATRTSYSDTANVVSMLVKGNSELFGNVDEAVKFNNAATMLFKSAGKTNEDIASLMEAINKSFQKGYVDSETISQLLERAPEAVALLNKRLGTTSDQLEDMATEGTMTIEDLKAAFIDNIDEIEAGFGNVQYSITDALTVIRSKWGLWLAQTNETLGITDGIGRFMVSAFNNVIAVLNRVRNAVTWLADKLGGVDKLFRLIAITAAAAFAVFNFSKITSGLSSISKLLTTINVKTLAIIAIIVLLALLVEDFINFMQGNDSLIGSLLEKAGVDVEAVRQTIINAWNAIKSFLLSVWDAIKKACTAVWNVISSIFSTIWGFISGVAQNIWNTVTTAFTNILTGITTTVTNIKDAIINGFMTAIDWIKSLPAQALQWGADIINGIVDGIKGAIGAVGDAVAGVADKIKSFLGFSEPDEGPLSNFHTYMPDMIDLMSKGITAGKEKVRKALEGITGEMSVMASANMVSRGTAATAAGTSQISKSVVLNSNINNTFNGDQAIQQKAAGTMDRSARDVTSELARGLAYAR